MDSLTRHDSRITNHEQREWRLELGATVTADGVSFLVWAPKRKRVELWLEDLAGQAEGLHGDDRARPCLCPVHPES